jgi:cytoskeleton protein RodZ
MFVEELMLDTGVERSNDASFNHDHFNPIEPENQGQSPAIAATIAAQLVQSVVYQSAIAELQPLIAAAGGDAEALATQLLNAVGLEAIRLTLQSQSNAVSAPQLPTEVTESTETTDVEWAIADPAALAIADDAADIAMFTAIETAIHVAKPSSPIATLISKYKVKRKAEVAEELMMTREEILVQLGEHVHLQREEKGLTIAQLHARTFIPMYHLQALEGGHVEQLPEDIYLRGFLRRIENALNLTVGSLTDKMPSEVAAAIVPEWYNRSQKAKRGAFAGLDVNPSHMYMTYAAIMAGGVCWLSNQTPPKASLPDLTNYEPRAEASPQQRGTNVASRPSSTSATAKVNPVKSTLKVGATPNMAPPEIVR